MKLKYQFVTQEVADGYVAVAVGADAQKFGGLVRMNETSSFLFSQLAAERTEKELTDALLARYDVDEAQAGACVAAFAEQLRREGVLED